MSQRVWKKTSTLNCRKVGERMQLYLQCTFVCTSKGVPIPHNPTEGIELSHWVLAPISMQREKCKAPQLNDTIQVWVFLIAEMRPPKDYRLYCSMTLVRGILHSCTGHQQTATSHTDLLCDVQLRTISIPQGVVFRVWQRPPGRGRRRIHKLLPPFFFWLSVRNRSLIPGGWKRTFKQSFSMGN